MLQEEWEKEVATPSRDTPATLRDSDFARRLYEEESARNKPKVDDFEAVIDIIKSDAKIEADEKIGKRILLLCESILILSLPSSPVTLLFQTTARALREKEDLERQLEAARRRKFGNDGQDGGVYVPKNFEGVEYPDYWEVGTKAA